MKEQVINTPLSKHHVRRKRLTLYSEAVVLDEFLAHRLQNTTKTFSSYALIN